MSTSVIIISILAVLGLLWTKFRTWSSGKKVEKSKDKLQELKDEANKKVGAADAAYSEFNDKLRDYKSSKDDK